MHAIEFIKSYWRGCVLLLTCVALLTWTLFAPPPEDYGKSLYRLITATLATILAAHLAEAFETRKAFKELKDSLAQLARDAPADRLYQIAAKYDGKTIPKERVQDVWYELCAAMSHSYSATNYGNLRSMYGSPIAQAALAFQKAKIKGAGFTISKVFMVDSLDEVSRSREIRDQRDMGIDVRWIDRKRVPDDSKPESIDFAIFDDKVVLAWELDGKRQITGAWICDDRQHLNKVEQYKKFFRTLLATSEFISGQIEHDITLRRLAVQDAIDAVSNWGRFRPPFEELNYAIDKANGWLITYGSHSESIVFGLYEDQRLIGFSILDGQPKHQIYGTAELYIAVDRDHQKRGLGKLLADYTVAQAKRANLSVFLRIRKNHPGGRLYEKCGFDYVLDTAGSRVEAADIVNGKKVSFYVMSLCKA